MKNMIKENISNFLSLCAAIFIYIYTKLVQVTSRVELDISRDVEDLEASNKATIYALWHGRMFPMAYMPPKHKKMHVVISRHGDGDLIAKILSLWKITPIRGSTNRGKGEAKKGDVEMPSKNRGGLHVLRESIRALQEGGSISITPDGPKGPIYKYKKNSLTLAAKTGAPIVPISFSCKNAVRFKSWDKFLLILPFAKIKVGYGKIHYIPDNLSEQELENYSQQIENDLNNITLKLDEELRPHEFKTI